MESQTFVNFSSYPLRFYTQAVVLFEVKLQSCRRPSFDPSVCQGNLVCSSSQDSDLDA